MPEMKICPQCSEESEPQFDNCWNCGAEIGEAVADLTMSDVVVETQETTETVGFKVQEKVDPSFHPPARKTALPLPSLGWSVLALFVCVPLGLIAVFYSLLAEIATIQGNSKKVEDYAKQAMNWRTISFCVAGVMWFLVFITSLIS